MHSRKGGDILPLSVFSWRRVLEASGKANEPLPHPLRLVPSFTLPVVQPTRRHGVPT